MTDEVLFDANHLFDDKPKENQDDIEPEDSVSYRKLPSCSSLSSSIDEELQQIEIHYHLQKDKVKLPAMEVFIQSLGVIQERDMSKKPKKSLNGQEKPAFDYDIDYSMEVPIDMNVYTSSLSSIEAKISDVPENSLNPREQEESDEAARKGVGYLFENKFLKAKSLFQTKSNSDPLYMFGLGFMTFLKAMMTNSQDDIELAYNILMSVIKMANVQIGHSAKQKIPSSSWSLYFSSMIASRQTEFTNHTQAHQKPDINSPSTYMSNGILRANAIKADCYLIIAILQLPQEIATGYIQCRQNIKKALKYYSIVWQEYKRMGQDYTKYMDRDTVSSVQLGMGSIHLLVSVLPHKTMKAKSFFGFKCDLELGLALLKLCVQGKCIRSPLASLMLLSYYSLLSTLVPQIHAKELKTKSMECLLDAQKAFPSSCFFLYYAAQTSRSSRELALSTQSFTFAVCACHGEWMDDAMVRACRYEIGFNFMLQLDWSSALVYFEKLGQDNNQELSAFYCYLIGSCRGMMGQQTESILAFAQVPQLMDGQHPIQSSINSYIKQKVNFFQKAGYQDLNLSLPALELLLVWNAFHQMETTGLEKCLVAVQSTLDLIYEREILEYTVRLHELLPSSEPPNLYEQRAIALLIRAAVLNALGQFVESISHLNWIMDHSDQIVSEAWIIPFALWEAGITGWGMNDLSKSRTFWERAATFSNYPFEHIMKIRTSLALSRCSQLGATVIKKKKEKGLSTNGQKRMPIVSPGESS